MLQYVWISLVDAATILFVLFCFVQSRFLMYEKTSNSEKMRRYSLVIKFEIDEKYYHSMFYRDI